MVTLTMLSWPLQSLVTAKKTFCGVAYEYVRPRPTKSPGSLVNVNVPDCATSEGEAAALAVKAVSTNTVMAAATAARLRKPSFQPTL